MAKGTGSPTLVVPTDQTKPDQVKALFARTREVLIDFFDGPNEYQSTAAGLQRYFDAYAASKLALVEFARMSVAPVRPPTNASPGNATAPKPPQG